MSNLKNPKSKLLIQKRKKLQLKKMKTMMKMKSKKKKKLFHKFWINKRIYTKKNIYFGILELIKIIQKTNENNFYIFFF
jgi:hypothetical protein